MFSLKPKLFWLLFFFSQTLSAHSVFNGQSKVSKSDSKLNERAGKDTIHYDYSGHGYQLNVVSTDQINVHAELICFVYKFSRKMNDLKQVRFERKQILPGKVAHQVFRHLKNIETLSLPLKDIEVDRVKDGSSFDFNWKYGQITNQFNFQTDVDVSVVGYDLSKIIRQKDSIDEIINLRGHLDLLRASLNPGKYTVCHGSMFLVTKSNPMFKKWVKCQGNSEINDSAFFMLKSNLRDSLQMALNVKQFGEGSGICKVMVLLDKFGTVEVLDIREAYHYIKTDIYVENVRQYMKSLLESFYFSLKKEELPIESNLKICFLIEFKNQANVLGFW